MKVTELIDEKLAEMAKTIVLKRAGRSEDAVGMVASQRGKRLMDQLRAVLGEELDRLYAQRVALRDDVSHTLGYNVMLGIGASLMSLSIIVTATVLAARSMAEREDATRQASLLAQENACHAEQTVLRAERLTLTAQMLQALDSVNSPVELSDIVPVFLKRLLPDTSGAIYLFRNSRDYLELKAQWGDERPADDLISPKECWGLRLGKIHQSAQTGDLRCAHHTGSLHDELLNCVPMISQGEVIGLMVVYLPRSDPAVERDLVITVAEQLSLAISNLTLRETLQHQSTVDPLTGLYNRRYFDESLRRELVRANRLKAPLAIVMIDLDHFKRINDTYGHDGGDMVLKAAAKAIRERARASDIACRYGGEELVLVLPECSAHDAAACAEKIRQSIGAISLSHSGTVISGVSASFGIAAWPVHGTEGNELIKTADHALYAAKKTGRNKVVIAHTDAQTLA